MAKICAKCGRVLLDDASVCYACGNPVETVSNATTEANAGYVQPAANGGLGVQSMFLNQSSNMQNGSFENTNTQSINFQNDYTQNVNAQGINFQNNYSQNTNNQNINNQNGYAQNGYAHSGYDQPSGYDQSSYNQSSYNQGSFNQSSYSPNGYASNDNFQNGYTQATPTTNQSGARIKAPAGFAKWGIAAAIAVVAILLIAIIVNVGGRNSGVNGAIKKLYSCYENKDAQGLSELYSSVDKALVIEMLYLDEDDYLEVCEEMIDGLHEDLDDEIGGLESIDYEILENENVSDEDLEDIKEEVDSLDISCDLNDIDEIKHVELLTTYNGNDDKITIIETYYLIHEADGWRFLEIISAPW